MSDYPMLISNKLHSFRNFKVQSYKINGDGLLLLPSYFFVPLSAQFSL